MPGRTDGMQERPDPMRNFILQQGLEPPAPESCPLRFSALMFQPRVVGLIVIAAVALQSPLIFLAVSGILWWNVLLPRWNPFDALYNRTRGARPGAVRIDPAPPPRRFAQGMAGSFMLAIGGLLLSGMGTGGHRAAGAPPRGPRRAGLRPVLPGLVRLLSPPRKIRIRHADPPVEDGSATGASPAVTRNRFLRSYQI